MNQKYMDDAYLKEFETTVKTVKDDKFIVLTNTIFYPRGGGQPCDTGKILKKDGEEFNVVFVGKFSGEISHEVDKPGLKPGDKVACLINWPRRYAHMRYHTAAHIISGILYKETGCLITGNQISESKLRIDFNIEDFDKDTFSKYIDLCNLEVKKNIDLKIFYKNRKDALKLPGMVKLANAMPPDIDVLRIVEIPGIDMSADGGTHIKNTSELGTIKIIKFENKGKNNRRIYVKLI